MQTPTRYNFWLRNLHWVIAILVISALSLIELNDLAPRGSALRSGMLYWHMQFGIAVLILFLPRIIVRLFTGHPAVVPALPLWQRVPATLMHIVLYLLILVQPVLGVLMMQAKNRPPAFLGMHIPVLVSPGRDLAHQLTEYHELFGNIFLWLVIVHAAAAFWHHWGRKDNTMRRMTY